MKIDLTGHIAVVTGASGELGRVISRTLAQCGAAVAIHYLNKHDRAAQLERDIRAAGGTAITVQADVTNLQSILAMRDAIRSQVGDPDIVVTNAVIQYTWTTILEQQPQDYESQFRSCVLHNVFMAKAFVPAMVEKRWGRFIGINTECAMQNNPSQSAYVSGKRGMDGVLRVLAKEVGPHQITVNQIAPGWMISEKDRLIGREVVPEHDKNIPLRHRGEDQDVANTVAFLASDLARFISGVYLPVCGGNVMPCI
jgi:3-oxoacyl-[acyl-carrier protein] reductase